MNDERRPSEPGARVRNAWYWLLLVPFVAISFPFVYNRPEPALFGLPFFYWYQYLWVVLTPIVIGIVLVATRVPDE